MIPIDDRTKVVAYIGILVLFTGIALNVESPWRAAKCPSLQEPYERDEQQFMDSGSKDYAQTEIKGVDERDENRIKCLLGLKRELMHIVGPYLKNRNAMLLDQVFHWNIGDSFIQHGTHLLLADLGSPVRIPCTQTHHFAPCNESTIAAAIEADPRDAILVFQGGGNFGDLYMGHRSFINQYVEQFLTTPFLLMPQSVHYKDVGLAVSDAKLRAKHPDFQMLARDLPSLDMMRKWFPSQISKLSPDAAQYIGPVDRSQCQPSVDVLFLVRRDGESVKGNPSQAAQKLKLSNLTYRIADWFDKAWIINKHNLSSPDPHQNPLDYPKFRTQVGIKMLCEGRMIVTDRLHATIMSTLMGLPHVFLDNSYGKIHSYRAAIYQPHSYCSDKNLHAYQAQTFKEAVKIVTEVFKNETLR